MKLFRMIVLICLALLAMDIAVAGVLYVAKSQGKMGGLVRYFDYGRSVPGKLAAWASESSVAGNLFATAWRNEIVAQSDALFAAEDPTVPVVRAYGMSFVNNILTTAQASDPDLVIDLHSGPGVPPNYTYALFEDDRANRRAGDIVVLGILSQSISAMGSLSNQTWVFEQPAPMTYPIYLPDGSAAGLSRRAPQIESVGSLRDVQHNPDLAADWAQELQRDDALWTGAAFRFQVLDISPFARLVRRSTATRAIQDRRRAVLNDGFPYAKVLDRMVTSFALAAREDGQIPVVFLIQTADRDAPDLLDLLGDRLTQDGTPVLATEMMADPDDQVLFLGDGHFKPEIDAIFADAFLRLRAQIE